MEVYDFIKFYLLNTITIVITRKFVVQSSTYNDLWWNFNRNRLLYYGQVIDVQRQRAQYMNAVFNAFYIDTKLVFRKSVECKNHLQIIIPLFGKISCVTESSINNMHVPSHHTYHNKSNVSLEAEFLCSC